MRYRILGILLLVLVGIAFFIPFEIAQDPSPEGSTSALSPRSCERPYSANYRIDCYSYHTHKQGGFELPLVLISQKQNDKNTGRQLLIKIPGGPGQGAMTDADEIAYWLSWLEDFDLGFDLLIYDPRATYKGKGYWRCEPLQNAIREVLSQNLPFLAETEIVYTQLTSCLDTYSEYLQSVLVTDKPRSEVFFEFTTDKQAADIVGMITALKYDQAHLWGSSYGTRVALYAARSEVIKTLILDSVYPFDKGSFSELIELYDRSFDIHERLFKHYFPNSTQSYRELYSVVTQELDVEPITLSLPDRYHDKNSQEKNGDNTDSSHSNTIELVINQHRFLEVNFGVLYYENLYPVYYRGLLNFVEDKVVSEDFKSVFENFANNALDPYFNPLLFHATECLDNAPEAIEHITNTLNRFPDLKDSFSTELEHDICRYFPLPKQYALASLGSQPVYADKPTLIFAGQFDPITPMQWAQELNSLLPRSRLIIAYSSGHGPLSVADCDWKFIETFIHSGAINTPIHCNFGEI